MKRMFLFVTFLFLLVINGQSQIDIKDQRELFVDHHLIHKLSNLRLMMHAPHDEGVAFAFDQPWEGVFSGYVTILQEGDLIKAYYRGLPVREGEGSEREVTCYAQSKDGIRWEKPHLKMFKVDNTLDNNVVLADAAPVTHNFTPFIDKNPHVSPQQRYKALGGNEQSGLIAYVSGDGLHWTKLQEKAVIEQGLFDSQNCAFWSEKEQCYVAYVRLYTGKRYNGFRSVGRATSTDFVQWSEITPMTFVDDQMEHLYTQQTSPYFRAPHLYLAIGGRFMPNRQVVTEERARALNVDPHYYKECSDVYLMSSRGGNQYDRTFMEAFIRPGIGLFNWVSRTNYPALNVIQTGATEMSLYVSHDYAQPTAHLRRYSMRLDGFTSINAPYEGGTLLTKPFRFQGEELEINYSTSAAGEIRVEIQDQYGTPIPGYTLEDAELIIGNEIDRIVRWKKGGHLGQLAGTTIRLRIVMKDADLYAIQFK